MAPPRRGLRARRACQFCRQRKMRCTGEEPQCKNCEAYEQECVFVNTPRRPRPTNAALKSLLEENRRLRERASNERDTPATIDDHDDALSVDSDVGSTTSPTQNSMHDVQPLPIQPSITPSINANVPVMTEDTSTYHGPTSTLFNDAATPDQQSRSWLSRERAAWMPKLLVSAAAEQRQMETINFRAGKLDFDGLDPELGLHLLNLHWNRQHHSFLVTYRPAFMRDMACNGPYFSKILLNAIYYGASKFSPRLELRKDPADVRTAGWRFRNRVRDLLGEALDHSDITTIQAMLQMTNSLFALGDEQSAAWVYAGIAFRMIVDLGLHVDATAVPSMRHLSEEDLEIRTRIYWAAHVIDKIQSLYQGRPPSLKARDAQVPLRLNDTYEELEEWRPFAYTSESTFPGSPSYSVSTFTELCKLCIILHDVLDRMYCEGKEKRSTDELVEDITSLDDQMLDWTTKLPEHLKTRVFGHDNNSDLPPPHVLSLQVMYNALRVLLHRPLVADGHLHTALPWGSKHSFAVCTKAAIQIIAVVRLYDRLFSIRRAPYLISYATYVAATIHVRIAATRTPPSEAHDHLRTCLHVLDQNSETNYAVRKASVVIRNLMQRKGVIVNEPNAAAPTSKDQDRSTNTSASSAIPHGNEQTLAGSGIDSAKDRTPNLIAGAMSGGGPTSMAEYFGPDLDEDAIIMSFMQDQNINLPSTGAWPMADLGHSGVYNQDGNFAGPGQAQFGYGYNAYDDTLFGLNATSFDYLYPS